MRLLGVVVGLLVCSGLQVRAQDPAAIRATMQASIEKQRESVRKQASTAPPSTVGISPIVTTKITTSDTAPPTGPDASPSFFTVDWPTSPEYAAALAAPIVPDCDPLPAQDVDALVDSASQKEGVKPELLKAVMEQESGFKPCAISPKGAQGLMQLMPDTVDELHVNDVFDPAQNVSAGAKLLRMLLDKYNGDTRLALGAYNAGGARVDQSGDVPSIPETQDYVNSILNRLSKDAATAKPVNDPKPAEGP